MNQKFFFSFFLLVSIVAGCKSPKAIADLTENDIEFTLNRGSCFGKCPVYELIVYNNGFATLDKKRFIKAPGKYERMLSKDEYSKIKSAFKSSKFTSFQDEYVSQIPDLPSITIGYTQKGILKKVKGKDERPTKIMELQSKLEKLIDNDSWILKEAYPAEEESNPENRANEVDETIYSEIIIEPASGVRLPIWFKENEVYGIRLITRISQELNLWLITYNTQELNPEQIMKILKNDKSIKTAEFNKKLTSRDR